MALLNAGAPGTDLSFVLRQAKVMKNVALRLEKSGGAPTIDDINLLVEIRDQWKRTVGNMASWFKEHNMPV